MLSNKYSILLFLFLLGYSNTTKRNIAFIDKLAPSVKEGGFEMENYWVWGASVIKGEDGKYHMFASRWPKDKPFFNGYIFYSEVVRAMADKPEGPFTFQEVVFKTAWRNILGRTNNAQSNHP